MNGTLRNRKATRRRKGRGYNLTGRRRSSRVKRSGRTVKKEMKGGAWWEEKTTALKFNAEGLKKLKKASSTFSFTPTDKMFAKKIYMKEGPWGQRTARQWDKFLEDNHSKYTDHLSQSQEAESLDDALKEHQPKLEVAAKKVVANREDPAAQGELKKVMKDIGEQWGIIGNYKAAKGLFSSLKDENEYVGKKAFHKYYGEGTIVGYETTRPWRGWFVRFEARELNNYLYNFRFKHNWLMNNNILVHKPTEYVIADYIAAYNKGGKSAPTATKVREVIANYPFAGLDQLFFKEGKKDTKEEFAEHVPEDEDTNLDDILNDKGKKLDELLKKYGAQIERTITGGIAANVNKDHKDKTFLHRLLIMFKRLNELRDDEYVTEWIKIFSSSFRVAKKKTARKGGGGRRQVGGEPLGPWGLFFCIVFTIAALGTTFVGGFAVIWICTSR